MAAVNRFRDMVSLLAALRGDAADVETIAEQSKIDSHAVRRMIADLVAAGLEVAQERVMGPNGRVRTVYRTSKAAITRWLGL